AGDGTIHVDPPDSHLRCVFPYDLRLNPVVHTRRDEHHHATSPAGHPSWGLPAMCDVRPAAPDRSRSGAGGQFSPLRATAHLLRSLRATAHLLRHLGRLLLVVDEELGGLRRAVLLDVEDALP